MYNCCEFNWHSISLVSSTFMVGMTPHMNFDASVRGARILSSGFSAPRMRVQRMRRLTVASHISSGVGSRYCLDEIESDRSKPSPFPCQLLPIHSKSEAASANPLSSPYGRSCPRTYRSCTHPVLMINAAKSIARSRSNSSDPQNVRLLYANDASCNVHTLRNHLRR